MQITADIVTPCKY